MALSSDEALTLACGNGLAEFAGERGWARIRHASVTSSLSRSTSTFASRSIISGQPS
jgi:hypothetical protein